MTYDSQRPETIQHLFADIATCYDRCNQLMSFSMHRRWNQKLVDTVLKTTQPEIYVDLCAGTGDIAFSYLEAATPEQTYLIDFCPEMLDIAKGKAQKLGLQNTAFVSGDAQDIPLPAQSTDCVTIAYGIRNVANPAQCIREVHRILRPGGRLGILELTRPKNPLVKLGHAAYLKTVLPLLGLLVSSNKEAYQYLCRSIKSFVSVPELEKMFLEAGFYGVEKYSLCGGIATIVSGKK